MTDQHNVLYVRPTSSVVFLFQILDDMDFDIFDLKLTAKKTAEAVACKIEKLEGVNSKLTRDGNELRGSLGAAKEISADFLYRCREQNGTMFDLKIQNKVSL